jgi:hypothetical protein
VSKKPRGPSESNPGWFRKGSSGNPKGRPKSSPSPTASAFEVLTDRTLTVSHRGGTREITVEEALQQRTYQDALAGKRMAMREVLTWIVERDAWLAKHEPKAPRSGDWLISTGPHNADDALLVLGIAAPAPSSMAWTGMLLEPWAVQTALSRRRGGERLTEGELDTVRLCTRDPDSLRWPRGTGR